MSGPRTTIERDRGARSFQSSLCRFLCQAIPQRHVHFLDLINEREHRLIQAGEEFDPEKNASHHLRRVVDPAVDSSCSVRAGGFVQASPETRRLMYRLARRRSHRWCSRRTGFPRRGALCPARGDGQEVQTLMQAVWRTLLSARSSTASPLELADVLARRRFPRRTLRGTRSAGREELLRQMAVLSPKERLGMTLRHGVSDKIPKRLERDRDNSQPPSTQMERLFPAPSKPLAVPVDQRGESWPYASLHETPARRHRGPSGLALGDARVFPSEWIRDAIPCSRILRSADWSSRRSRSFPSRRGSSSSSAMAFFKMTS